MTEQGHRNKLAYIKRYQRSHYANISIKVRYGEDDDIIRYLNQHKNGKSAYIKKLIRADNQGK